jgi:hypothetical protein
VPISDEFDRQHLQLLTDKLSQKNDELTLTRERLSTAVDLSFQLGSEDVLRRLLQSFDTEAMAGEPSGATLLKKLHEKKEDISAAISSLEKLTKNGRKRSRSLGLVKDKSLHLARSSNHRARTTARRP